jgi:Cu-processing system ATP-binding protein
MIEFKNINKKYRHIQVLKDINLNIEKGSCVVCIGPNGCGKTTLLKCMLNMVMPESGCITINKIDVGSDYESKRNLGFMPQMGCFPENMTVNEIIKVIISIRNYGKALDNELYEQFEIQSVGNKKMNTLSGGTVQKVSASIAFMFNPEIIVMDEPFAGLDLLAADILRKKIIKEKENGKTVLLTSHTFSEIDGIVSHVVFMNTGEILFYKPLQELLSTTGKDNVTDAVMCLLKG